MAALTRREGHRGQGRSHKGPRACHCFGVKACDSATPRNAGGVSLDTA